jgi:hypothetical protein
MLRDRVAERVADIALALLADAVRVHPCRSSAARHSACYMGARTVLEERLLGLGRAERVSGAAAHRDERVDAGRLERRFAERRRGLHPHARPARASGRRRRGRART